MKLRSPLLAVFVLLAIFITAIIHTQTPDNHYSEDFFTNQYKDALNTTALWDTVAGQVRLRAFQPFIEGSYNTTGTAKGIDVDGDYAYIADGTSGLHVINISDVSSPSLLGTYDTPGDAERLQIEGKLAYVADGDSGLVIVDVSNPASPALAGGYDTPGYAYEVFVAGDHAFVADGDSGLVIVDVSDPSNPTFVGQWITPFPALGVAVMNTNAFIAAGDSGLFMIDVTNPSTPVRLASLDTPGIARGVTMIRDAAIVADDASGVHKIFTITPGLIQIYKTVGSTKARDVSSSGFYHYVADDVSGFKVVHTQTNTLAEVYTFDTPGITYGVVADGAHAFVADGAEGLHCVRIGEPLDTPALYATDDGPGGWRVAAQGRFAATGTWETVLNLFWMLGTSVIPRASWSEQSGIWIHGVELEGNYCYISNSVDLTILDVTWESTITEAGRLTGAGFIRDIKVSGYHLITATESWLRIFDIRDPSSPSIVSTHSIAGNAAWQLDLAGDLAYVAADNGGVRIVNISDRTSPSDVGNYVTPSRVYDVTVAGDYAYVADADSGLIVLDISNPASPARVASSQTVQSNYAVAVSGNILLVGTFLQGQPGVWMFDVTDPTNPVLLGTHNKLAMDFEFVGNWVYSNGNNFNIYEIFQRTVKPDSNLAVSTEIDPAADPIHRALLTSTHVDSVGWQLSADGGAHWEDVTPGVTHQFTNVGSDLLWRSTHVYVAKGNPTASGLDIEWRGPFEITSIEDVPNDQGRQVRLAWTCGGNDIPGNADPTTEYHVYRKVDTGASATPAGPEASPPGDWYYVTTVPATGEYFYSTVVPTLADSVTGDNNQSTFYVRAMTDTPGLFWDTAADSGFSVDNLLPGAPAMFFVTYGAGGNSLRWEACADVDFDHYRIYRGTFPDFPTGAASLVYQTTETSWFDPTDTSGRFFYKITVVDNKGNESRAASAWVASPDGPSILSITDIAGDQGRRVGIRWQRSPLDSLGSPTPITEYALFRKHDPDLGTIMAAPRIGSDGPERVYPPGEWDYVLSVPATLDTSYAVVASTLADSTIAGGMYYTTFFIRALTATPAVYHDSEPDSGYSVDNTAPAAVTSFAAAYNTGSGNQLDWDPSPDWDFRYFQIYRDVTPGFTPGTGNELHTTAEETWTDPAGDHTHYYKITAVDFSGNKGDPTAPDLVTGLTSPVPRMFALYQNTPNPFNPSTTIRYDVPAPGGGVSVSVYSVNGALVKTLINGFQTPGKKSLSWNGTDLNGRRVASGVYFYRLETSGYTQSLKMVLIE